ncbi:uncharacterized protein B0H18DRAFT_660195 [Fomitopsis serialis]|uniref:uncharacterized protein n=1 Tax=Fomitopsis serialis TaxID=139415 RepID=UPI0020087FBC|nr:uncharacterized protein B0H18DRAFT_660195 [Neoantrodia serialis]KAH9918831.1 hypothetical protein B0H18DRAFT_660195 [Neoantrodia serialis]
MRSSVKARRRSDDNTELGEAGPGRVVQVSRSPALLAHTSHLPHLSFFPSTRPSSSKKPSPGRQAGEDAVEEAEGPRAAPRAHPTRWTHDAFSCVPPVFSLARLLARPSSRSPAFSPTCLLARPSASSPADPRLPVDLKTCVLLRVRSCASALVVDILPARPRTVQPARSPARLASSSTSAPPAQIPTAKTSHTSSKASAITGTLPYLCRLAHHAQR